MEQIHAERMVESATERILTGLSKDRESNKTLIHIVLQEVTMNAARRTYLAMSAFVRSTAHGKEEIADLLEKKAEEIS